MFLRTIILIIISVIKNQLSAQNSIDEKPKVFVSLHAKYGFKKKLFFTDQIWEKYLPEYKNPHDSLGFILDQSNQDLGQVFFTFQIDKEFKFDEIKNDKLSHRFGFFLDYIQEDMRKKSFLKQ